LQGAKRRGNPFSFGKSTHGKTDCHTIFQMVRNDMGIGESLRLQELPATLIRPLCGQLLPEGEAFGAVAGKKPSPYGGR
jgi:hypothetical protein